MADKLVTLGIIAGAGIVAYKFGLFDSILGTTTPAPAPAPTPTPAPAPAPDPNAIMGANTIDGVYAKLAARVPAGASKTIDDWNWELMQVIPNYTAPDPMPLFAAAVPGFDRAQAITIGQYWKVMAPAVKSSAGLTGLGFRGLGMMFDLSDWSTVVARS